MIWIRTYRILIFLITAFLMSGNTWSQNVLHRNNYFIQEYLINPAFTGGKDFNPFYMSYRNQFSQLQERPQVFSASGYYVIDPSSNIAGSLYSSETPSFTQLFGELNYSHDYHFSQWAHFTFGAGLIFNQTSQDFSNEIQMSLDFRIVLNCFDHFDCNVTHDDPWYFLIGLIQCNFNSIRIVFDE